MFELTIKQLAARKRRLVATAFAVLLGVAFMRRAVSEYGQTIVMVTHDPGAASYSDRVVFLNDGRIVDEMFNPTADTVLDRVKRIGG